MARPLRIEYSGAYYYVTNRAHDAYRVFPEPTLGQYFLALLAEISQIFKVEILAYCLLEHEYHLMIRTPEPNLSRAMRHLNGLFTQYYNRHFHREGPLFRGRYRAILLQAVQVGLPVSRYLHLLPVQTQIVNAPEEYRWSSCRAYLKKETPPACLHLEEIQSRSSDYASYLAEGMDVATKAFFTQKKCPMIFGSPAFRALMLQKLSPEAHQEHASEVHRLIEFPSIIRIQQEVAKAYYVHKDDLLKLRRGYSNLPRMIAIYLARFVGAHRIADIAQAFCLKSHSAVSMTVRKVLHRMQADLQFAGSVHRLLRILEKSQ